MNGFCVLASLLLLAACSSGTQPIASAPPEWSAPASYGTSQAPVWQEPLAPASLTPPGGGAPIEWRADYRFEAVELRLTDPRNYYRVQDVRLIDPAGRSTPAAELTRNIVREAGGPGWYGRPSVGVGGAFGSRWSGVGVGLSFPLGNRAAPAPAASITTTDARLPVADPDYYRRTAQSWTIEVLLLDPSGELQVARIPAPPVRV